MNFQPTRIDGAYLLELQPNEDERGFFARRRSDSEFAALGLNNDLRECSVSLTTARGTLRGMHYQIEPHGETKLVTCMRGRIFDVIVDLRQDSVSYMKNFTAVLSFETLNALYIPAGVAHGYLTMDSDCVVQYDIAGAYVPEMSRGARWNDPAFGIEWPFEPTTMSARDRAYEDFLA